MNVCNNIVLIFFFLLLCPSKVCSGQSNLVTASVPLASENYIRANGGLNNIFYRIKTEKKATIAFLGGSITNMKGWRDLVCGQLREDYPETEFTFINAGIPSLGSLPHAFRLQQDVLDKGAIDLLFIESAVNDETNGTPVKTQQRALEGIVRHTREANPYADIVLMAFTDPGKMEDYRSGKIPGEVQVHEDIAEKYRLPFINLAKEITDRIDAGEFTWEGDFKDLHPSPFGQEKYFQTINTLLDREKEKGELLERFSLPPASDQGNYSKGHYLDVHEASRLHGFKLVEDWTPAGSTPTRKGFVHVPVLEATRPGASFQLEFKGSLIGIGLLSGPDAGILEYSIDGSPFKQIDLYTQWSAALHLPWYLVLADDLAQGGHQLKVRLSAEHHKDSNGTGVRLVRFLEN